jgi:hypothetical protein
MVRGVGFEPTNLAALPPLLAQVLAVNSNVCLDLTSGAKVAQLLMIFTGKLALKSRLRTTI